MQFMMTAFECCLDEEC